MKTIKKITFISTKIRGGGAERVVAVLSSALADLGYHVDLILYERYDDEYPISNKVKIHMLPSKTNKNKIFYLANKFLKFRGIISELKPDVLIPFLPYQVEQTYFASRGLKIPMVVTVRNNPLYDTPNEKMRKRRDWIAEKVEGVFLQTESQKDYFCDDVKKKSFVIENPISENVLKAEYIVKKKIRKLVSVGRLEEQKNFSMLIDAFSEAKKEYSELTLDIYGEGSFKEQLESQINKLGLDNSVRLCGRTNDIVTTLVEYDLFIMTSNYEGMPNSLMEAMGIGLPCISTDCPTGPKELIGADERGILVKTGNKDELVNAIIYSVANVSDLKMKACFARNYIKDRFAPDRIAGKLVDELEKVIN